MDGGLLSFLSCLSVRSSGFALLSAAAAASGVGGETVSGADAEAEEEEEEEDAAAECRLWSLRRLASAAFSLKRLISMLTVRQMAQPVRGSREW
jgi:hypothetical protein